MQEIWKDVVGYEGLYQVSNFGRVKSLDRYDKIGRKYKGKIIKQVLMKNGYLGLNLCVGGSCKTFYAHRIVASAFLDNPQNLPQINHKDENKQNNFVDNLEWCDSTYNNNYGTARERANIKKYIPVYCIELNKRYDSMKQAGEEMGVPRGNIGKACRGVNKSSAGYHWRYAD